MSADCEGGAGAVYQISAKELLELIDRAAEMKAGQMSRDMTQAQFCRTLGISPSTLWRHAKERGDDNYKPAYFVGDSPRYKWAQVEIIRKTKEDEYY